MLEFCVRSCLLTICKSTRRKSNLNARAEQGKLTPTKIFFCIFSTQKNYTFTPIKKKIHYFDPIEKKLHHYFIIL